MSGKVRIDTRECDRIMRRLDVNADQIIRRIAFQVEASAKQKAPYDTSALRNSIYVEGIKGSYSNGQQTSFSTVSSNVTKLNENAQTEQLPKPKKEGYANVGPCVNYAAYVEYPGAVRKGGERPYLTPAAEEVARNYNSGKEWESLTK